MQEYQFLSDLVVNFMQGLSDYSPKLIEKYFRDYDEEFPEEDGIKNRLDHVFNLLSRVRPEIFGDTIFKSA